MTVPLHSIFFFCSLITGSCAILIAWKLFQTHLLEKTFRAMDERFFLAFEKLERFFSFFDSHSAWFIVHSNPEASRALFKLRQLQVALSKVRENSEYWDKPYLEVTCSVGLTREEKALERVSIEDLEKTISMFVSQVGHSLTPKNTYLQWRMMVDVAA